MTTEQFEYRDRGDAYETSTVVAAGTTYTLLLATAGPCTVAVYPAQGATATVSLSCSPLAKIRAGEGAFAEAEGMGDGGVTTSGRVAPVPTPINAVRVSATGGDVLLEVLQ